METLLLLGVETEWKKKHFSLFPVLISEVFNVSLGVGIFSFE